MRVAEVMTHAVERVSPAATIGDAARLMRDQDIGTLMVEDETGDICGIVTDRDIACRAVAEGMDASAPVEACMSRGVLSCHTMDGLYDAIELMKREQVRRLLVRDLDEKPVGVLAQADVAQGLGSYDLTGEMLEEVSQPGGKHSQQ